MPGEVKLKLIVKLYNSYKVWVNIKTAAVSETILIILELFDTVLWQLCLSAVRCDTIHVHIYSCGRTPHIRSSQGRAKVGKEKNVE